MAAVLQKVFLGGALLCALACAADEQWKSVDGARLRELFKDKEFADGVHFAYRFNADGTFSGTEMASTVSGSWRVRGAEFCWTWLRPPGPSECYCVQQDGAYVRLLVNDSEAWWGTLR